ncbi:hypothetical protein HDU97_005675 [Phlyctochytrium planicorne]|nr:hypothetical protein HDU97_005675 [Phlyctochytrium planicorne]
MAPSAVPPTLNTSSSSTSITTSSSSPGGTTAYSSYHNPPQTAHPSSTTTTSGTPPITPTSPGGNAGAVDYLSFQFNEFDLHQCWRNATRHKDSIINGRRLENASWRRFFQMKFGLETINPATLNWQKDSDVCWLYGPFHHYDPLPVLQAQYQAGNVSTKDHRTNETSSSSTDLTTTDSKSNSKSSNSARTSVSLKPALKKRRTRHVPDDFLKNLRETYLRNQRSSSDPDLLSSTVSTGFVPGTSSPLGSVTLGTSMSVGSALHSHRKADFFLANAERDQTLYRNDEVVDADLATGNSGTSEPSSRRSESPSYGNKQLRFAEQVEQRLIVEPSGGDSSPDLRAGGVMSVGAKTVEERGRSRKRVNVVDPDSREEEELSTSSRASLVSVPAAPLKSDGPDYYGSATYATPTSSTHHSSTSTTSNFASAYGSSTSMPFSTSTPSTSSSGGGLRRSGSGSGLSALGSLPVGVPTNSAGFVAAQEAGGLKRTTSGSGLATSMGFVSAGESRAVGTVAGPPTSSSTPIAIGTERKKGFGFHSESEEDEEEEVVEDDGDENYVDESFEQDPSHFSLLTDDDMDDPTDGLFMLGGQQSVTPPSHASAFLPFLMKGKSGSGFLGVSALFGVKGGKEGGEVDLGVDGGVGEEEVAGGSGSGKGVTEEGRSRGVGTSFERSERSGRRGSRGERFSESSVFAVSSSGVGSSSGGGRDGVSGDFTSVALPRGEVEYGIVDRVSDLVSNAVDIVRWAKGQLVASS